MMVNTGHYESAQEIFESYGVDLKLALMHNVQAAIAEDKGSVDWTGLLIAPAAVVKAKLLCRDEAVICGQPWFDEVFRVLCPQAKVDWLVAEGERVPPNTVVCTIEGHARAVLTAERPAMNFLQTLSAVASRARHFAELVAHTKAKVLDTRKTLPSLRLAQKYAVRVGGGENQRLALYDGILIKENHIAAAGGITEVLDKARAVAAAHVPIQIEVESLEELSIAVDAGAKSVLLDNFSLDMMAQAVQRCGGKVLLEASGGINEQSIVKIAETGVDRISIGSLTKDITAVDFSMRVVEAS